MQNTVLGSSALTTSVLLRIFRLYVGLAIVSIILCYLGGGFHYSARDLSLSQLLGWIWAAGIAVILDYSRRLFVPPRSSFFYKFLFLAPALIQIGQDITLYFANRSIYKSFDNIYLLLVVLDISLVVVGALLLRSVYIEHVTRLAVADTELKASVSPANDILSASFIPFSLLGGGNGYVDRVIKSVIDRSIKSERHANFSLTVMLILVMIGGMASFGLWAFTHAERISTLEDEKNKLIKLQGGIQDALNKLGSNDPEAKQSLERINEFIKNNYPNSETYRDTLNRLSQQSQSNYADIAIRVTIAVLTIFLVQVFFAVYKYNRHLANMLAAKAEALELAGSDDDSRKELSREAVSIVKESVPGFGTHPRTPFEEVVQMADKLRKHE
ncbi:MAG: hypothetical protein WBP93_01675 [Pyrinomonadaceae bacterium]